MGQARRKKLAGYVPPQLPRFVYKGLTLSMTKTKRILRKYPEIMNGGQ
jgi:hypothetical protein